MLLSNLNILATAPGGVARLRELILTLAVQGKLVPQDAGDEPASVLIQRVVKSVKARPAKSSKVSANSDEFSAPYELPNGWAWSRLGDIVENMGSGWSPACDEGERSDPEKWAVLRTTAVQVNEYRAREHKVIPLKLSPRPEIEVKDGDILITRAGPMNRVGISCWVNDTPPRLMLSDKIVRFHSIGDEMLPAFIVLALNAGWTKKQIEVAKTGMAASQVNISQTDLRGLWLPVCSKAEQSRIVTRVEELMRLCDALEAKGRLEAVQHARLVSTLLDTLTDSASPEALAENWQRVSAHFDLLLDRPEAVDALEQTILQLAVRGLLVPQDPQDEPASILLARIRAEKDRLIAEGKIKRGKPLAEIAEEEKPFGIPSGWEWVKGRDLFSVIRGVTYQKTDARDTPAETHLPILRANNIRGTVNLDDLVYVPASLISEDQLLRAGDYVVCLASGSKNLVGKAAPFTESLVCSFGAFCGAIRPIQEIAYFAVYLASPMYRDSVSEASAGIGINNLKGSSLLDLDIALPPDAEQSRIVARVASLRRLCFELRQRLKAAQSTQAQLAQALIEEVA